MNKIYIILYEILINSLKKLKKTIYQKAFIYAEKNAL